MKTKYLLWFGVLATLNSCNWGERNTTKPDINTDTLAYTYKTIKERAADCGNKPDSSCSVAKIVYPIFVGQVVLNDTITARLLNLFMSDKHPANLQQYAKDFIASYNVMKKQDNRPDMFFTLNSHANIIRQDSSLTTLEVSGYNFQGGAHGSTVTNFINWNTKANKALTLSDVFQEGYKEKLTTIADTIFRKQEKLAPTQSLANDYFFKDNKFALNENFSITPLGIKFLYNQYEIKPYAAGQTTLLIPYAKIKSLLKPNTIINQYLK